MKDTGYKVYIHKNIKFEYSTHKEYIEWYYGNNK